MAIVYWNPTKPIVRTWREVITEEMTKQGETWDDVESCVLGELVTLDDEIVSFKDDWKADGEHDYWLNHFTIWTAKRVYFPATYDCSEWCASVARHPDGKATWAVGG